MSFRESILNNCDIFANPFYFKVKGHDKLGTKAGLFMTILVCFIGIGSLIYMIDDMQKMNDPVVNVQEIPSLLSKTYIVPEGTFYNAIGMADSKYTPILNTPNKTYYEVHFDFCSEQMCERVDSQKCPKAVADYISSSFGADIGLFDYSYCMNQSYFLNNTIRLSGGLVSLSYDRMELVVDKCVNRSDSENICASESEINAILKDSYIISGLQDYRFDPNNPKFPYKPFYKTIIQQVIVGQAILSRFMYLLSTTITTTNFYFFFPSEITDMQLELEEIIQEKLINQSDLLGKQVVQLSSNTKVRSRSYKNIISVFGNLGGLLNIVIFVFRFLMSPINWLEQRLYLSNEILKQDKFERLSQGIRGSFSHNDQMITFYQLLKYKHIRQQFFIDYQEISPKLEISYLINKITEAYVRFRLGDSVKPRGFCSLFQERLKLDWESVPEEKSPSDVIIVPLILTINMFFKLLVSSTTLISMVHGMDVFIKEMQQSLLKNF